MLLFENLKRFRNVKLLITTNSNNKKLLNLCYEKDYNPYIN